MTSVLFRSPEGFLKQLCRSFQIVVLIAAFAGSAWSTAYFLFATSYRPDYSVFWTASHVAIQTPAMLYDSAYVTDAQSWLVPPRIGPRPYAYPPSALLLFLPFSELPFWPSLVVWDLVSFAVFTMAARSYARGATLLLAVLAPPTVFALISGQTSLLIAAATMFGLSQQKTRPALAGVALGVAAAIKPQSLLLTPILLCGDRKALGSFFAAGAALALTSLPLGPHLWVEWLRSMPAFSGDVAALNLMPRGVTPATIASWLEFGTAATTAMKALGIVAGTALAIWSRNRPDGDRLVGLAVGGLLCSPYAMSYELAVLMPVAASALLAGTATGLLRGVTVIGYGGAVTAPLMAIGTISESLRNVERTTHPVGPADASTSDLM